MDTSAKHIADAEALIARQERIVAELERDKHHKAAAKARAVLVTMQQSLEAMKRACELSSRSGSENAQ